MAKQRLYRILSLLALPLVMGLFFNQAANWHLHRLDNGTVIEHAHPFERSCNNNSPFQDHHHSGQEFIFLGMISNALTLLLVAFVVAAALFIVGEKVTDRYVSRFATAPDFSANLLRAPPVIL